MPRQKHTANFMKMKLISWFFLTHDFCIVLFIFSTYKTEEKLKLIYLSDGPYNHDWTNNLEQKCFVWWLSIWWSKACIANNIHK